MEPRLLQESLTEQAGGQVLLVLAGEGGGPTLGHCRGAPSCVCVRVVSTQQLCVCMCVCVCVCVRMEATPM